MLLEECVVWWQKTGRGGKILVLPLDEGIPDPDGNETWFSTGGCYDWVGLLPLQERRAFIVTEALSMIVRDGLDPLRVHHALLAIREYCDMCAPDMPGLAKAIRTLRIEESDNGFAFVNDLLP